MMKKTSFLVLALIFCTVGLSAEGLPDNASVSSESLQLISRLQPYLQEDYWTKKDQPPVLTRDDLVRSVEGMRAYFLNHQFVSGKFLYAENIRTNEMFTGKDHQVRQAGALWGVSLLLRDRYNEPTRRAVVLGMDFFLNCRQTLPDGNFIIVYPNETVLNTGTVAIFCLALTEFLYSQDKYLQDEQRVPLRKALDSHLDFLKSMELTDGGWGNDYDVANNLRSPEASPYYDGETLLAYCKAARYMGRTDLLPRIQESLPKLLSKYTVDNWDKEQDLAATKAFAHWGCLAMAEYAEAGWGDLALPLAAAKALTNYNIYENKLLEKTGNTGYAVEGLIGAWRVAMQAGDQEYADSLRQTAMQVLGKLSMMQVGNPHAKRNTVLSSFQNIPEKAVGGVTQGFESDLIRIDLVQHQTHATLMALKYFFPEE